ncbi:MAG: DUF1456 family protein [Xanthomonadales bacterium]|nr:DUF1456 family protein [Xanthomonadales bacterium]
MTNNDILRRIRYIFAFDDDKMIAIFGQADREVTRAQISSWMKKDDDEDFAALADVDFACFLNGLINDRRGRKEGVQAEPEKRLNNNIIFLKLKIALDMKAEDVLNMLKAGGMEISKHELSAFFRRADHKHYRECQTQCLRSFLKGLQLSLRGS